MCNTTREKNKGDVDKFENEGDHSVKTDLIQDNQHISKGGFVIDFK